MWTPTTSRRGPATTGTATVVEIANALAAREDELETRIHLVAFGAEEVGLCGSGHDSENRDPETVKAVLNNDGVVRGRTLKCYTQGFDGLETAAQAVADRFDHPMKTTPRLSPHSDHWPYVERGVPGHHTSTRTTRKRTTTPSTSQTFVTAGMTTSSGSSSRR